MKRRVAQVKMDMYFNEFAKPNQIFKCRLVSLGLRKYVQL